MQEQVHESQVGACLEHQYSLLLIALKTFASFLAHILLKQCLVPSSSLFN